ncbi:MAG: calcium/sodium antiporter [bacterium]
MLVDVLLLAVGTALLIGGAVLIVDSAASLARHLGVSALVVGLTIVAVGTSAPEMAVTVLAALRSVSDISLGNIMGSNIFNILAVLGIASLFRHISVARSSFVYEIPMCVVTGAILLFFARDGQFARIHGLLLLVLFGGFIAYTLVMGRRESIAAAQAAAAPGVGSSGADPLIEEVEKKAVFSVPKSVIAFVGGVLVLIGGAHLVVESAVAMALALNVPDRVIALTIVAVGTSLPEVATSVMAVIRGQSDIAVGNAVGSTLLNTFLILGLTVSITPIPVSSSAFTDIVVFFGATVLLLLFALTPRPGRIHRVEGIVLISGYIAYVVVTVAAV